MIFRVPVWPGCRPRRDEEGVQEGHRRRAEIGGVLTNWRGTASPEVGLERQRDSSGVCQGLDEG